MNDRQASALAYTALVILRAQSWRRKTMKDGYLVVVGGTLAASHQAFIWIWIQFGFFEKLVAAILSCLTQRPPRLLGLHVALPKSFVSAMA